MNTPLTTQQAKRRTYILGAITAVLIVVIAIVGVVRDMQVASTSVGTSQTAPLPNDVQQVWSTQLAQLGESYYHEYAEQASATPESFPTPVAPQIQTGVNTGDGSTVVISWTYPEQHTADGFVVSRALQSKANDLTVVAEVGFETREFIDTTVQAEARYIYTVEAVRDYDGTRYTSESSEPIPVVAADTTAPAPPHTVTVQRYTEDPTALHISWGVESVDDIDHFTIYRSSQYGVVGAKYAEAEPEDTEILDTTVQSGKTYYYTITAVDAQGNESAKRLPYAAPGNDAPFAEAAAESTEE